MRFLAVLQDEQIKMSGKPPMGAAGSLLLEHKGDNLFKVAALYTYRCTVPKYFGALLRTGKAEHLRDADDRLRKTTEGVVTVRYTKKDRSGYSTSIVKTLQFRLARFIIDNEIMIHAVAYNTNYDADTLVAFRSYCNNEVKKIKVLFSDELDKLYGQKNYKYKLHKKKKDTTS